MRPLLVVLNELPNAANGTNDWVLIFDVFEKTDGRSSSQVMLMSLKMTMIAPCPLLTGPLIGFHLPPFPRLQRRNGIHGRQMLSVRYLLIRFGSYFLEPKVLSHGDLLCLRRYAVKGYLLITSIAHTNYCPHFAALVYVMVVSTDLTFEVITFL